MRVFFAAPDALWADWSHHLRTACPQAILLRDTDGADPADIDALLYAPGYPADGGAMDFAPFTRARLVQSLWAGVERIVGNPTLTQPLCRMVDPGLTQGMVDYCVGWAMRAHLDMDRYAQDGVWRGGQVPPLAGERDITVLGTGALGAAVARALAGLGFRVAGWSRSGRAVDGVATFGGDNLDAALRRAQILITLLPDTPDTRDLLNADRLARLPRGTTIINPGRGTLIDDRALLAAVDSGQVGHAVLDVFRHEPLPPDHPFWVHPGITVTPHIAAETRTSTAAQVVADNLRRAMDGRDLLHRVDTARGY